MDQEGTRDEIPRSHSDGMSKPKGPENTTDVAPAGMSEQKVPENASDRETETHVDSEHEALPDGSSELKGPENTTMVVATGMSKPNGAENTTAVSIGGMSARERVYQLWKKRESRAGKSTRYREGPENTTQELPRSLRLPIKVYGEVLNLKVSIEEGDDETLSSEENHESNDDEVKTGRLDGVNTNMYSRYVILFQAISRGDCEAVKNFLEHDPAAVRAWISEDETPLLTACSCGHLDIVTMLLQKMRPDIEEVSRFIDWPPLQIVVINGNIEIAEALVEKYSKLPDIALGPSGYILPVTLATQLSKKELAQFLFEQTSLEVLKASEYYHANDLLKCAITHGMFGIALELVKKCPPLLAVTKEPRSKSVPMLSLALCTDVFEIPHKLGFWKALFYSCVKLDVPPGTAADPVRIGQPKTTGFQQLVWKILQCLPKIFGVENLYALKLMNWQARELLQGMVEQLSSMNRNEKKRNRCGDCLFLAVRYGNREFVMEMIKWIPSLLWNRDNIVDSNLFYLAVMFRQEHIFNLFYGLDQRRHHLVLQPDSKGNTILQVAAEPEYIPRRCQLVAPLKLQWHLKWFKEVESIVPEAERRKLSEGLTPREQFESNYEDMREEAETWMKEAAKSCSVVAILIATIAFQAIFTVPGGLKSVNTGEPIKLMHASSKVYVIAAVFAFIFASTATFIFLGILTARHSFDDFLNKLPRLMFAGQLSLILSVASTLTAFCIALFTSAHHEMWIIIPVLIGVCLLLSIFVRLQLSHVKDMISSTRRNAIFDRNPAPWL